MLGRGSRTWSLSGDCGSLACATWLTSHWQKQYLGPWEEQKIFGEYHKARASARRQCAQPCHSLCELWIHKVAIFCSGKIVQFSIESDLEKAADVSVWMYIKATINNGCNCNLEGYAKHNDNSIVNLRSRMKRILIYLTTRKILKAKGRNTNLS